MDVKFQVKRLAAPQSQHTSMLSRQKDCIQRENVGYVIERRSFRSALSQAIEGVTAYWIDMHASSTLLRALDGSSRNAESTCKHTLLVLASRCGAICCAQSVHMMCLQPAGVELQKHGLHRALGHFCCC